LSEIKEIVSSKPKPRWNIANILATLLLLIAAAFLLMGLPALFILTVILVFAGYLFYIFFLKEITPEKFYILSALLFIATIFAVALTPGAPIDDALGVIGSIATAFFGYMYSKRD
jgi:4-hydroxybenzoate polyprenyltransferase